MSYHDFAPNSASLAARRLVRDVTDCPDKIPDHRPNRCQNGIPFGNFTKSAFAMFQMKMSSLLQFDTSRQEPVQAHNLETLFDATGARSPCDTHMRSIRDLTPIPKSPKRCGHGCRICLNSKISWRRRAANTLTPACSSYIMMAVKVWLGIELLKKK